ncbi:cyclophilin-like fold protein [Pseudomonas syringae]|uniref:cyclophilin-like fold protein n=1 Tax=Pseudomonas syringae TaxID=317 RepID=UPI00215B1FDD|nr:cyclophilin-like fold protein [Pseudomonas syringae]MCR8718950.1 cyclophilin-like fold protein [Pseudomonas syringae]
MNISMFAGDKVVMFHLEDSATTRDFVSMLPLELTLEDYAATEKIGTLPRKLDVTGAAAGNTPVEGDIAYYAPWGNLAIYHKGFNYSPGLVRLGKIESGLETIRQAGTVAVRFERAKD